MMSTAMHNNYSSHTRFEDLPDEILLSVCSYLSSVNILDSLLNLNERLDQTITSYREKIFLSHLSYKDFHHFMTNHLPYLAPNINYLFINNCSMLNTGKLFEKQFYRIDQQFPLLRKLIFHRIDIDTLENLAWRFNTMNRLRHLDIDIADDRISSMPVGFDQFLCGKLFLLSNSFETLRLNLNKYRFSLCSIRNSCKNLHHLTISVKRLNDLLIIFDHFPNIEELNITIGCPFLHDTNNDTYPFERLWWKVPYLTKFHLSIKEEELTSHDNVIPNEIILKIAENILQLMYFKFTFDIRFSSSLHLTTTKDNYISKYFPYVNGSLWEKALKRNDNRSIHFQLHFELDGLAGDSVKKVMYPDMVFIDKNDDVDFNTLLRRTFSTAYWLQKNTTIQHFSAASKHVLICTLPITNSYLSTTIDIIDQAISVKFPPAQLNIQNLIIRSNSTSHSPKVSLTNLCTKFPRITHLETDTELLLPPIIMICFNHLRSLTLCNYSIHSCCSLLSYLPKVISLALENSSCTAFDIQSCRKPILSIIRLKICTYSVAIYDLIDVIESFPNTKEFYLLIKNTSNRLYDDSGQYIEFKYFLQKFLQLRYIEIMLPVKQAACITGNWENILDSNQSIHINATEGNSVILKTWL